jgi:peroxiredoxin
MFGSGGGDYNYEHFTRKILSNDLLASRAFGRGPRPGERAPDLELRTLEGGPVRLRDFRGNTNVVLTFGSATCQMTAGSIRGMSDLAKKFDRDETAFFLIYVREAHPGNEMPAHRTIADKVHAAEVLRDEEEVSIPILVDDLDGKVHRRYGRLPNPTYIVDKSGRIAFRGLWTQPQVVEEALNQLVAIQHDRGVKHAVVLGGDDRSMPVSYPALYSYRALHRGGRDAILDFEHALGFPGKIAVASSRIMGPVRENPGKTLAAAALGAGVLAAGLYAGRTLRRRRLRSRSPYENYAVPQEEKDEGEDYGVVGI